MSPSKSKPLIAILEESDREDPGLAREGRGRFGSLVQAARRRGADADTVMYDDSLAEAAEKQLAASDAVLVFVNPVHNGRGRSVLNALLERVAAAGTLVSAHPAVIATMGTKKVLVDTKNMGWSAGDTFLYDSAELLHREFPARLAASSRVLKQVHGNGGGGVWRVIYDASAPPAADPWVYVLHASHRDTERLPLSAWLERCAALLAAGGGLVDQPYLRPSSSGMVRCYLAGGRVAGFGHQRVGALTSGPGEVPMASTPRLYSGPEDGRFQSLRRLMEDDWVPALLRTLALSPGQLPAIWDADFFWWPPPEDAGQAEPDKPAHASRSPFTLCEINVSAVHPYPDTAPEAIVDTVLARIARRPA